MRNGLQVHIEETAKKILLDTSAHNEKHDRATRRAEELQATIRALEQKLADERQAHLAELNSVKA